MRYFFVGMMFISLGCANVTTTRIYRARDGSVNISSGKDVSFSYLSWREGGAEVIVKGYTSNASVDVINMQTQREKVYQENITEAVKLGLSIAGKAVVP